MAARQAWQCWPVSSSSARYCPARRRRVHGGPVGPSHAIGYADPGPGDHLPEFGACEEDAGVQVSDQTGNQVGLIEVRRLAHLPSGTVAQAAKIPILAVTPTEVLETMFHCIPSGEYPYSVRRFCWK
jgi:hypothetical protein